MILNKDDFVGRDAVTCHNVLAKILILFWFVSTFSVSASLDVPENEFFELAKTAELTRTTKQACVLYHGTFSFF